MGRGASLRGFAGTGSSVLVLGSLDLRDRSPSWLPRALLAALEPRLESSGDALDFSATLLDSVVSTA